MSCQLITLVRFALLILLYQDQNVANSKQLLGPSQQISPISQDASSPSPSLLIAHQQERPDLIRTTAHVRPTSSPSTLDRPAPQANVPSPLGHRDRASVPATQANASRLIAAASSHVQAAADLPVGTLPVARAKWRQMEQALAGAHLAASLDLKRTFDDLWPVLARQEKQISSSCKQSLDELVNGLAEQQLWASQMYDASASHTRLPSGLLEGTLTELGNFDECLAISQTSANKGQPVRGQYCSLLIRPPLASRPRLHTICRRLPSLSASALSPANNNNDSSLRLLAQHSHQFYYAGLRLGVCLPSRCTQTDVLHLLQAYLFKYELVGQVKHCQREPIGEWPQVMNSTNKLSNTQLIDNLPFISSILHNFDLTQKCILLTFLCLAVLSALGTWLDQATSEHKRRANVSTVMSGSIVHNEQCVPPRRCATVAQLNETRSLASKRARQYRVCEGSNSASCTRSKHYAAVRSSDYDLAREQIEPHEEILGLQRNPLAEMAVARNDLVTGGACARVAGLRSKCTHDEDERTRPLRAAPVDDSKSAAIGMPLYLEHELEQQAIGSSCQNSRSHVRNFLVCFSLKQNIRTICKLTTTTTTGTADNFTPNSKTGDHDNSASSMADIKVVHGIRTLSMIWIIFGHTVGLVSPEMMNNLFPLARLSCSSRLLQAVLNTTLAVDTFFMISGLVTIISFVRKCKSARDLIAPVTKLVPDTNRKVWPHTVPVVVTADTAADIEVSSVDSSSSAITSQGSSVSSESYVGLASKSSSQKNFIVNKTLKSREPYAQRITKSSQIGHNIGWPNDFQPLVWLLLRYLRLTPAYAFTIGLAILLPSLGSGPFWPETVSQLGATCRVNWWTNLLYVNNFIQTDKLCLIHSWYLSNDWQFFLFALILFGVYYKSRKLALIILVAAFVASSVTTFNVTTEHDYPPTIVTTSPAIGERWQFIYSLYYKPWPHLPAYLIGLIVGYAILKFRFCAIGLERRPRQRRPHQQTRFPLAGMSANSNRLDLSPGLRLLGWIMFGVISLAVLNSIYPWNMGLQVDPILTGLHAATFRTLWATCCGWLVFALVSRPRNPLGLVLSWHGFQVTSRLTYCVYLVHPLVIYYHFGTLRERLDSSVYGQTHRFLATLMLSYLLAFLVSLLVESPSIRVQKFLNDTVKSNRDKSQLDEQKSHKLIETHCVKASQRVEQSKDTKRESLQPFNSILQGHYYNSSPISGLTNAREGGCPYDSGQLCNSTGEIQSIDSGPAARSRARISTKTFNYQRSKLSARLNLDHDRCPHGSTTAIDTAARYPTHTSDDTYELSDDGCSSSNCSGHSAIDQDFQRKLAQAIGRGFRIRSRIANSTLKQRKTDTQIIGSQPWDNKSNESLVNVWEGPMKHEPGAGSDKSTLVVNRTEANLGTFIGANKRKPV